MANNYVQATVSPDIPKNYVTSADLYALSLAGISYSDYEGGSYYFYAEENFSEYVEPHFIDEPEKLCDEYIATDGITVSEVFLKIIARATSENPLDDIVIQGAYICDKMRRGDFGGFVYRITPGRVQYTDTYAALNSMRNDPEYCLDSNNGDS